MDLQFRWRFYNRYTIKQAQPLARKRDASNGFSMLHCVYGLSATPAQITPLPLPHNNLFQLQFETLHDCNVEQFIFDHYYVKAVV